MYVSCQWSWHFVSIPVLVNLRLGAQWREIAAEREQNASQFLFW